MTQCIPCRPLAGNPPGSAPVTGLPRGLPVALAALCFLALALPAGHARAQAFEPPDLLGYSLESERDADGDGDGANETHIMKFVNQQSDSLVSLTTRGHTWAWSLDTHDSDLGSGDYVIRDSDCDGSFDEVYGLDEEFHVPDCLK